MITRNFNLYLNAGHSVPLVINVNQYDSGEQWVFTLYNSDGTQYTPSTGAIVGIKADGLGIINSGSVVDGKVVINETQQMTAAVGKAVFELTIDSGTHGTANFVVLVEEKPGNNADLSDSDLSLIQEALDAVNPLPTGGTVGQVLTKTASGSTWSDAGTPTQEQVADAVSDWADEHITVSTGVVIDTSLSVAGAAADAKATGDEIADIRSAIGNLSELETEDKTDLVSAINEIAQGGGTGDGMSEEFKQALEDLVNHIAFDEEDPTGLTWINALHDAMYPAIHATSVTLNKSTANLYTVGSTVQLTATVLPSNTTDTLVWTSSNTSVATVSQTGLVTSVAYGTATITATAGSVSATCSVVVATATVSSISAVYTQSGTVYDNASLDSLKADLVVTATYSDSTTATVPSTDYTLSGTLTEGTSTITVSYGGKITTFNVTVTHASISYLYNWDFTQSLTDSVASKTATLTGAGSSGVSPTLTSSGIVFDGQNQICYLGSFGSGFFVGKTVEIDIANFDGQVAPTEQHYRLFMFPPTNTKGAGPLIYRNSTGWASYVGNTWSSPYGSEVTGSTYEVLNYFSGKTVKLVFDSSGKPELYVNGNYIGKSTNAYTGTGAQYAYIGGISSSPNYCYNMTVSGLRIYANL